MYELLIQWVGITLLYWSYLIQRIEENSTNVALGGAGLIALFLVGYTFLGRRRMPRIPLNFLRGKHMTGQAREAELRVLFADKITDILDDLYQANKISAEEYRTWADRFGNLCDLRDLISAQQLTLKQQLSLRNRLRKHKEKKGEPVVIPAPIPGPAPGTTQRVKNAFDALIHRQPQST